MLSLEAAAAHSLRLRAVSMVVGAEEKNEHISQRQQWEGEHGISDGLLYQLQVQAPLYSQNELSVMEGEAVELLDGYSLCSED